MLKSFATKKYKKAFKLAEKKKKDLEKLEAVLILLSEEMLDLQTEGELSRGDR